MTYKELTKELVLKIIKKYGIANNFIALEKYVDIINEKGKTSNLTGFKDDVLWEKGIYESISMMYQIMQIYDFQDKNVLDIGAGVGFPSVPFKIIFPNFLLTIHESNNKKYDFLNHVNDELNLSINIKLIRTEDIKEKEIFDLITARAVGSTKILAEISSRILKVNGNTMFLKGPAIYEELKNAKNLLGRLNYSYNIIENTDANINAKLVLLNLIKNNRTPKYYPRDWAIIKHDK